nr:hypothetical protein [Myxococcota bacterium]
LEGSATGAEAGRLIARTLAASTDLESAALVDHRATFRLETPAGATELRVVLEPDGAVASAEVRRFPWGTDQSTFRRQRALQRAMRETSVTAILADRADDTILMVGGKRFTLPGAAFVAHERDDDHSCGC